VRDRSGGGGAGGWPSPLSAAGVDIVGIDIDPVMLAVARGRVLALDNVRATQPRPLLVAADMRRFALAGHFAAAIVPYNSIQLLTADADVAGCLAGIRRHLSPGGIVGLELTDFQLGAVETDVAHQAIHSGQLAGRPIALSGSLNHDTVTRTSRYRRRFSSPGWAVEDEVAIRSYRRSEIAALLTTAGLPPARWWEDGPTIRVVGARRD
jgi:SAM-dependent methyltransferase